MDPLITNPPDPALLRTIEKRTSERELPRDRRRPQPPEHSPEEEEESSEEPHQLDDLA